MANDPNGGTPLSDHSVRFDFLVTLPSGLAAHQGGVPTYIQTTRLLPSSRLDEDGLVGLIDGVVQDLLEAVNLRLEPSPFRE